MLTRMARLLTRMARMARMARMLTRMTRWLAYCTYSPDFGGSRFPDSSLIPFPVSIFCIFPNHALNFGQIPDPKNTFSDPGETITDHGGGGGVVVV